MKNITGKLTMLGNSTVVIDKKATIYSVIEIGDTILSDVVIPNALDNYLRRGFDQDGECTLYIMKRRIMGLSLPDGKMYCEDGLGLSFFFWMMPISIITIPLFGMGLVSLYMVYKAWRLRSISKELQTMGGIVV